MPSPSATPQNPSRSHRRRHADHCRTRPVRYAPLVVYPFGQSSYSTSVGSGAAEVRLPGDIADSPGRQLGGRILIGFALLFTLAFSTYLERDGYSDSADGKVDLLDSFYYATVAITTTGYGDIAPVSDGARLMTTVLVTPLRIGFLVLLVGTSVELIAAATRRRYRRLAWRKRVQEHTVICGFGVKGQASLMSLIEQGVDRSDVVVVDNMRSATDLAVRMGCVAVVGDMTNNRVLHEAGADRASVVIVAPSRDDTAVLTVLSARSLNPRARVIAAARELENAALLRQSGADVVMTTNGSVGRMLGLASNSPNAARIVEDLLEMGRGLDIVERTVTGQQPGPLADRSTPGELVVAVFRDAQPIALLPGGSCQLHPGDRLVSLIQGG